MKDKLVFAYKFSPMEKYLIGIIVIYSAIVSFVNPAFFSAETLLNLLKSSTGTLMLALGVLLVIISKGLDVSFTAVAIVGGYCAVLLMLKFDIDNLWFAFFAAGLIGCVLGMINACLIYFFKLQTLIVTLGTASVFYGCMTTFVGTKSIPVSLMPKSLVAFGTQNIITFSGNGGQYGLSVFVLITAVCTLGTWFMLYKTMLGRNIFAIGNSEEAASRIGINIFATKSFIYAYMGAISGVMGIVYFSELQMVNPISLVGTELMVIAAVVIGGAKLSGGEGTILGTILGVMIIQLFKSTLVFLGLSTSWNELFTGIVLLASVGLLSYKQRKKNQEKLMFLEGE